MTSPLAGQPFVKMNGAGNAITILDLRGTTLSVSAAEARAIAAHGSTSFDQLMVIFDPRTTDNDGFMRIFNTDGSESSACGNGTRCVSWYMLQHDHKDHLMLETAAGLLACRRDAEFAFTIDMGMPRFAWQEIPLSRAVETVDHSDFSFETSNGKTLSDPAGVNMEIGRAHV